MSPAVALAVAAVILQIVVLIGGYFMAYTKVASRLTKLEADGDLFWTVLRPHLATAIHSPTAKRRDELMDKYATKVLTDCDEATELAGLLRLALSNGKWDGTKRLAGAMALYEVEKIAREKGC